MPTSSLSLIELIVNTIFQTFGLMAFTEKSYIQKMSTQFTGHMIYSYLCYAT